MFHNINITITNTNDVISNYHVDIESKLFFIKIPKILNYLFGKHVQYLCFTVFIYSAKKYNVFKPAIIKLLPFGNIFISFVEFTQAGIQ